MIQQSSLLSEYAPELQSYLHAFPRGDLSHVENFFYWTKEDVTALKPMINLFHATLYTQQTPHSTGVFITTKRLYASHYFESAFSVTAFVDETGGDGSSDAYVLYRNRSRFDHLRGPLKGLIVSLMKNRMYTAIQQSFHQTRERLEAAQMLSEGTK